MPRAGNASFRHAVSSANGSARSGKQRAPLKIGYARVSTEEQNLQLQIDALARAGCDRTFTDHGVSGTAFSRPGLDRALAMLRPGDTLVVWRLDRLGRSLSKLTELINFLARRRIEFASITETINTNSPGGVLVFHLMAALAEFERSLISERTRAGLDAAKAQGKQLGRRHALSPQQQQQAVELAQSHPIAEIAARYNVHPRTIKRLIQAHKSALSFGDAATAAVIATVVESATKSMT